MSLIKNPIQMLEHWENIFPDQVYLRQSSGDGWGEYTWKSVANKVRTLATYILSKEYTPGSNIAIWATNSVDWIITDLAIMLSGHVSVPLYPAQDLKTAQYILSHSEPKLAFLGQFNHSSCVDTIFPEHVETIGIHGCTVNTDRSITEIIHSTSPLKKFNEIDLDNVATIIYSSGTSGSPKGVMLTFRAISQTQGIIQEGYKRRLCAKPGDKREHVISYLPMSHAAERSMVLIASLYLNSCISISAGLESFSQEMRDVRPTFFGAVPRIWYKFMQGIEAYFTETGESLDTNEARHKARCMLGLDRVENVVTGSAPVSPSVHKWYENIGIYLRESYGMSETFAYATLWSHEKSPIPACVGVPLKGIELKINKGNEILIKSPVMMRGYYKDPEQTAATLIDGWYYTGDLGRLDENGNLWLNGRVGSVFKTSKGKFVNPEPIEKKLLKELKVEHICVFGHGLAQPVAVACIAEVEHASSNKTLQAEIIKSLEKVNDTLPVYEKIEGMWLTCQAWSVDSGELTPTLKIKRSFIESKYSSKFDANSDHVFLDLRKESVS